MKKLSLITSLLFSYLMFPQDPTFLWVKSIGGTITENGIHSATDVSENLYLTGSFEGTVDFDPGIGIHKLTAVGNKDIFIMKLDPNGNFIWAKSIGGSGEEVGNYVTIDKFGDVYVTGSFEGCIDFDPAERNYPLYSSGNSDIFLQKLNPDGNLMWAVNMGGASEDFGIVVKTDDDANIYLLQAFSDKADLNPGKGMELFSSHGNLDISIEKLNSRGEMIWVKAYGGGGFDKGNDMVLDGTGNIYVTGSYQGEMDFDPGAGFVNRVSNGYSDVFMQKFRNDGSHAWVRCMGGIKGNDSGSSLKLDDQGNIYSVGYFEAEMTYSKSSETLPELPQLLVSAGGIDAYVQKLNENGYIEWIKAIGGKFNDFGKEIYPDTYGNILVVGEFIRSANNNLEDHSRTPFSTIRKGIFIDQLSDNGSTTMNKEISNSENVTIGSMVADYSGSIYLLGHFEGAADFDPGAAIHSVVSKGAGATYILKLSPYGNPQINRELTLEANVSTYPNPVKNKLTVELGQNIASTSLTIFDVVGNLVKKTESRDCSQINLDLNLNPGIYYVNISSENNTVTKKIIVE